MPNQEIIVLVVQIVAALGVVVSVVYLGLQIKQQNTITKAQFGHSLTQRLYDRYFQTSKDLEYAKFMSTDWHSDKYDPVEGWRISMAIMTYLVDLFDVYDKVKEGLVDRSHLDTRMRTLKLGVMKTPIAKGVWQQWKGNRSLEFIEGVESEIYTDTESQLDENVFRASADQLNITRHEIYYLANTIHSDLSK